MMMIPKANSCCALYNALNFDQYNVSYYPTPIEHVFLYFYNALVETTLAKALLFKKENLNDLNNLKKKNHR